MIKKLLCLAAIVALVLCALYCVSMIRSLNGGEISPPLLEAPKAGYNAGVTISGAAAIVLALAAAFMKRPKWATGLCIAVIAQAAVFLFLGYAYGRGLL